MTPAEPQAQLRLLSPEDIGFCQESPDLTDVSFSVAGSEKLGLVTKKE